MPETPKPKPTPKPGPPKPAADDRKYPNTKPPYVYKPHLTTRPFKNALADLARQMEKSKQDHPSNGKRRR